MCGIARLPYPEPDALSEPARRALEAMPDLNVFRMLAHAEGALVPFLRFTGALWGESELSVARRELAILQVAARTGAEYEWTQHVAIARAEGVPEEQIDAVRAGTADADCFDPAERAVLRLAEAVVITPRADDGAFEEVRRRLSDREIVEVHLIAGLYLALARLMTNLELELDEPAADTLRGANRGRGRQ
jgi:4-carboxymuconolactone decarboxylase